MLTWRVLFPNTPGFLTDLAQEGLRRLGVDYQCGGQRGYPSCLDCGLVGNEYFGPGSLESKPYPHTKGCRKVCEQAENVWINGSNLTMSTSKPDAVRQYKNLWFTDIWTMIIKSETFDYHDVNVVIFRNQTKFRIGNIKKFTENTYICRTTTN